MFGVGNVFSELREFGNKVVGCVCCIFLTGPILVIVGIALLVSASTDSRGSQIATYNDAVGNWVKVGGGFDLASGALANATWYTGSGSTISVSAATVGGSDLPAIESAGDIKTYSSRVRSLASTSAAFSAPWVQQSGVAYNVPGLVVLTGGKTTTTSFSFPAAAVTSFRVSCSGSFTSSDCRNKCTSSIGSYNSATGLCTQYWVLQALCFAIDPFTGADDGAGCAVVSSAERGVSGLPSGGGGGTSRTSYALSGASFPGGPLPGTIPLTVRSSSDPWVVAMRLTGGTGNFGLTVASKIGIGIALLIIGIILAILPCFLIYALIRCCQHRKAKNQPNAGTTFVTSSQPQPQQQYVPQQQPPQMYAQPMMQQPQPGYPPQQVPQPYNSYAQPQQFAPPPPQPVQQPYAGYGGQVPQAMPMSAPTGGYAPQPQQYPPQYAPQYQPQQGYTPQQYGYPPKQV